MTPEEQLINDILVLEERKIFLNPLNQEIKKAQKEDRDKLTMRQLKAVTEYASTKAEEVAIEFYFEATGLNEHPNSSKNGDAKIKEQLRKDFDEWYTQYKLSQI